MRRLENRAIELFAELCDLSVELQAERLEEIGKHSADLRSDVEELLAGDRLSDERLGDTPVVSASLLQAHRSQGEEEPDFPESAWIGRVLGSYRLEQLIGRGGQAWVYRATHADLERQVAVKVLHGHLTSRKSIERLRREALAMIGLKHDNIVDFYDFGCTDGVHWLAMEFVPGESAGARVRRDGPLPTAEVERIVGEVLCGLARAHGLGGEVVHRDLSANNVLLRQPDDQALIADFGLASGTNPGLSVTNSHTLVGTLAYIAPEVYDGQPATHRSDLWSVGILACELATGAVPFRGSTAVSVMHSVCNDAPDLTRLTSVPLRRLATACLVKDPAQRIETAGAALEMLQAPSALSRRRSLPRVAALLLVAVATCVVWLREDLLGAAPPAVAASGGNSASPREVPTTDGPSPRTPPVAEREAAEPPAAEVLPVATDVRIEHEEPLRVGASLVVRYLYTDPQGRPEASRFRWFREGEPIDGATDRRHELVEADVEKQIAVAVLPIAEDGPEGLTVVSPAVSIPPPTLAGEIPSRMQEAHPRTTEPALQDLLSGALDWSSLLAEGDRLVGGSVPSLAELGEYARRLSSATPPEEILATVVGLTENIGVLQRAAGFVERWPGSRPGALQDLPTKEEWGEWQSEGDRIREALREFNPEYAQHWSAELESLGDAVEELFVVELEKRVCQEVRSVAAVNDTIHSWRARAFELDLDGHQRVEALFGRLEQEARAAELIERAKPLTLLENGFELEDVPRPYRDRLDSLLVEPPREFEALDGERMTEYADGSGRLVFKRLRHAQTRIDLVWIPKAGILGGWYMARTETTNAQWNRGDAAEEGEWPDLPKVNVSYFRAEEFAKSFGFRLPRQDEWKYAAAAGQTGVYCAPDELGDYAWFRENAKEQLQPVASKRGNPWELFDMHGSVWEWTASLEWVSRAESPCPTICGGCFLSSRAACSSEGSRPLLPHPRRDIGFRVVFDSPR